MWANPAVELSPKIAVEAKNLEVGRKSTLLDITKNPETTSPLSMLAPATIDVIDRQESRVSLTTASTFIAVMIIDLSFEPTSEIPVPLASNIFRDGARVSDASIPILPVIMSRAITLSILFLFG